MPAAASVSVQLALSKPTNVASLGTLCKGSTHTVAAVMAQREKQESSALTDQQGRATTAPLRSRMQKTTASISYEDVIKLNEMKSKWRPVKKSALNRRDLSVKNKPVASTTAANAAAATDDLSNPTGAAKEDKGSVEKFVVDPLFCAETSTLSITATEPALPVSTTPVTAASKATAPPAKWYNMPVLQETYGGGFNRATWVREDQVEFCRSDEEFYAQLRDAVAGREPTQLPPFDPAELKYSENSGVLDPSMFPNIIGANSLVALPDNTADISSSSSISAVSPAIVTPSHRFDESSIVMPPPRLEIMQPFSKDAEQSLMSRSMPQLLNVNSSTFMPEYNTVNDEDDEDFGLTIKDDDDDSRNDRKLYAGNSTTSPLTAGSSMKPRASTANSARSDSQTPKSSNSKRSRSESNSKSRSPNASSKKKKKKVITLGNSTVEGEIDERSSSIATPTPHNGDSNDTDDAGDIIESAADGPHPCGYPGCGKVFSSHDSLRKHLKTHRVRDFVCDQCGKSFLDKSKLNRHQLVHSGQKAFECEICGKRFSLEYNMRTHQRIHSGERPFECFCKRSFAQSTNLKNHLLTHVKKGEIPSDQAEDYILRLYKRGPRKDIVIEVPDLDGAEGEEELHDEDDEEDDDDGMGRLEVDDGRIVRSRSKSAKAADLDSSTTLPMDEEIMSGGIAVLGEEQSVDGVGLLSSEAMLM